MAYRIKLRSDDFDVIGAVPRDLSVIKNFLKRDCAVKRLIEIEEDFVKKCMEYEAKANECSDENNKKKRKRTSEIPTPPPPDPCARSTPPGEGGLDYCDPCRRLKTSVVLEEVRHDDEDDVIFLLYIVYLLLFTAHKACHNQSTLCLWRAAIL